MQDYFYALADEIRQHLTGGENFCCAFSGEDSDFVRFTHASIRQAGAVEQYGLRLSLIDGRRHAGSELSLSGVLEEDRGRLRQTLKNLRRLLPQLAEDPYLLLNERPRSSSVDDVRQLPESAEMAEQTLAEGGTYDLVGILAGGSLYRGFANGFGQRNWHGSVSFNLDWSLHHRADKAVKARYAGFGWEPAELSRRMRQAGAELERLALPPRRLPPGRYRALLSPAALEEIFALLSWNSFGLRAARTGQSALRKLTSGETALHPEFSLSEATAEGIAPNFQDEGFIRPDRLALVERGEHRSSLVSPRSAAEYQLVCNGADAGEQPHSLSLAAGALPREQMLAELDRGLYIGNLWYLNFSDRNAARVTGMTRFGTFWVEDGELREPVEVLRFDDTLYELFGERLLGLSRERELLLDPGTYGGRSTDSFHLPAALVEGMRFTL